MPSLLSPKSLFDSRVVGFDTPFEMLHACHERVQRSLDLLARLRAHLQSALPGASEAPPSGAAEAGVQEAARDVLRYFDVAAPLHHEDEERHVFPLLLRQGSARVRSAVRLLQQDHQTMHRRWLIARDVLQAVAEGQVRELSPTQDEALARFAALYEAHIRTEEELAYPEARALMDGAAQADMGREMAQRRRQV